jgi:hypothetical protein
MAKQALQSKHIAPIPQVENGEGMAELMRTTRQNPGTFPEAAQASTENISC